MQKWLDSLAQVDWDDMDDVQLATGRLFDKILETPGCLAGMLEDVGRDPHLMELSESNEKAYKITLHDADGLYRLRAHVFKPGNRDRPHSHRSCITVRMIYGGYIHKLYGTEEQLLEQKSGIRPVENRRESVGTGYVLDHPAVHSVAMDPVAVSLMVRGPIMKRRACGLLPDGDIGFKYGAAEESAEDRARDALTPGGLAEVTRVLRELKLL
jgi:hypothetical protein